MSLWMQAVGFCRAALQKHRFDENTEKHENEPNERIFKLEPCARLKECICVLFDGGRRGGGGALKTLMSCTLPPPPHSLTFSPHRCGPWQVLVAMAAALIAAGWLERGALVEKEREGNGKRETDHCRGKGELVLQFITPPSPPPSPHTPHIASQASTEAAAERPRCCSAVHTRQTQTSDCIYYLSWSPPPPHHRQQSEGHTCSLTAAHVCCVLWFTQEVK